MKKYYLGIVLIVCFIGYFFAISLAENYEKRRNIIPKAKPQPQASKKISNEYRLVVGKSLIRELKKLGVIEKAK